jgi:KEOPS complex subunit Pcc1
MTIRSEAEVEMVFPTPQLARKALLALKPEEASPGGRSSARISVRERTLHLKIEAKDTPSLRAALNSFLRLITVVRDMMELEEG